MAKLHRIFVFAPDVSADIIAASVVKELQRTNPDLEIFGVGADALAKLGLQSVSAGHRLTHVGHGQALKLMFSSLRLLSQIRGQLRNFDGDALITVDMASVSLGLAQIAKQKGIPAFHIVTPTVWAWRAHRAKMFASSYQSLYCIFPFEPPYFLAHGGRANFMGHPATSSLSPYHGQRDPLLLLMPGSRRQEIITLLPLYLQSLSLWTELPQEISIVVLKRYQGLIQSILKDFPGTFSLIPAQDRYQAMRRARCVMASMGTSNVELSLLATPHISTYKVDVLTRFFWRSMSKIRFLHIINYMAKRALVPELYQGACTPENLALVTQRLFHENAATRQQQEACAPYVASLFSQDNVAPAAKIAHDLLQQIHLHAR